MMAARGMKALEQQAACLHAWNLMRSGTFLELT
jgi:hypothetical protein